MCEQIGMDIHQSFISQIADHQEQSAVHNFLFVRLQLRVGQSPWPSNPTSLFSGRYLRVDFFKSEILYIVSKPRHIRSVEENAVTVLAWNMIDGRRPALPPVIISHPVSSTGTSHFLF